MTQNQQRFSGRELTVLLTQVRNQLGEDATIVEANRVRQGGIGGFFSKERFEVVASPAADPGPHQPGTEHLDELLDRAERVSTSERLAAGVPPRPPVGRGPEDDEAAEGQFQEILRTTLVELSEPARAGASSDGPPPVEALLGTPRVAVPSPPVPPVPPPPPTHRSPEPSRSAVTDGVGTPPPSHRPAVARPGPTAFWEEVGRFDHLLAVPPPRRQAHRRRRPSRRGGRAGAPGGPVDRRGARGPRRGE